MAIGTNGGSRGLSLAAAQTVHVGPEPSRTEDFCLVRPFSPLESRSWAPFCPRTLASTSASCWVYTNILWRRILDLLGLFDPISVPANQNKPQHRQKVPPAPPACLVGTLHIFLHILPSYTRRSPSPGLLVRPWHIGLDVRLSSRSVSCVTSHLHPRKHKTGGRCTLHLAPVGQKRRLPRLARALGFWSGQALATGTAWASLCLIHHHQETAQETKRFFS